MLLKEMNFRDIVDKYLYIDAAGVAQNLVSIFEVTEDGTGVLCYGYIDAQAGGSIRDDNVIETCDKYGIAMAFTGLRLFHH